MSARAGTQDALEKCLADLERLKLGRPANVLFSEYLAALVAEEILAPAAAERVAGVYHRSRYWEAGGEDAEYQDVAALLQQVVANLEEMAAAPRGELSQRVHRRLQFSEIGQTPAESEDRFSGPGLLEADPQSALSSSDTIYPAHSVESVPANESQPAASGRLESMRRLWRKRRSPLTMAVVGFAGMFTAGYFVHPIVHTETDWRHRAMRAKYEGSLEQVWQNDRLWNLNLARRAEFELGRKNAKGARHAYEILTMYKFNDPDWLNERAWAYLTDPRLHDSKRGFELATRAVSMKRDPLIIDTAAEAYFQRGDVAEAIKLQREAIEALPEGRWNGRYPELVLHLAKFVAKQTPAAVPPALPQTVPKTVAPAPAKPTVSAGKALARPPASVEPSVH